MAQRRKIEDDPKLLVCARADAELATPDSTFDFECGYCGTLLMIAPSGQRIVKADALMVPICMDCIPKDDCDFRGFAAPIAEVKAETKAAIPNMRRYRN